MTTLAAVGWEQKSDHALTVGRDRTDAYDDQLVVAIVDGE